MSLYLKVFFAEDQEDAAIFLIFALPVIGAVVEGMALPKMEPCFFCCCLPDLGCLFQWVDAMHLFGKKTF